MIDGKECMVDIDIAEDMIAWEFFYEPADRARVPPAGDSDDATHLPPTQRPMAVTTPTVPVRQLPEAPQALLNRIHRELDELN